jgi:hypothetical protein
MLAWAAARDADPVAKVSALVGAAAAMLQPSEGRAPRGDSDLEPRSR